MVRFSFIVKILSILLISTTQMIEAKEKSNLSVFIGAGCGYSNEALELITEKRKLFDTISVFVIEDSVTAMTRLNISAETYSLFSWQFKARPIHKKNKVKLVPTFIIGNEPSPKSKKYNTHEFTDKIKELQYE